MMILWFKPPDHLPVEAFLGQGDLHRHVAAWMEAWCERTIDEWVHLFIHALGLIPTAWYLDAELHLCTRQWETIWGDFVGNIELIGGTEALDEYLQDIDALIFYESCPRAAYGAPTWDMQMEDIVNFPNLSM